jgi:hypothetical protein
MQFSVVPMNTYHIPTNYVKHMYSFDWHTLIVTYLSWNKILICEP